MSQLLLSLFGNEGHKMNKQGWFFLYNTSLKGLTGLLNLTDQPWWWTVDASVYGEVKTRSDSARDC